MIYLASDHGGFNKKEEIKELLNRKNLEFTDCGDNNFKYEDDFVDFAKKAAEKIGEGDLGIMLCRNGVGVDIVANRFKNVRSVLGFDPEQVKRARADDNVNVLSLPADYLSREQMEELVMIFLSTPFTGEDRYLRRLGKIEDL